LTKVDHVIACNSEQNLNLIYLSSPMVIVVPPIGKAQRTYATEYKAIVARYVRSPAKSASSIVIVSSPDVDALCATRILTSMFRNEGVLYRVTPISGYPDLTEYREELLKSPEVRSTLWGCLPANMSLATNSHPGQYWCHSRTFVRRMVRGIPARCDHTRHRLYTAPKLVESLCSGTGG
jgi:hypothetical protein